MALNDPSTPSAGPGPSRAQPITFRPALYPSLLYLLGMLGIFLGERVVTGGTQTVCTVLGLLLLLGAIGARALRQATQPPAFRAPERVLLLLYVAGAVAVGLYFLNSDLLVRMTGRTLDQSMPRFSGALSALWPAIWLSASLPVVFVEMALLSMARAPVIETLRVRISLLSGLGIALALVFCFALTYVADERGGRLDFSYFRTARPGESTKKVVRALDKPVVINLFFPPANEVREEVETYFSELARESRNLNIQHWDSALHPAKAREMGVAGNGVIVVTRDALREQMGMPLELDRARIHLKSLDQDFQKRLIAVTRKQRIVYFTAGHEERSESGGDTDADRRAGIRTLRGLLTDQGFESRDLGLAQGLGTEVPADASVVFIIGPSRPFLPEETAALQRYIDRNGRVLMALDPDAGQAFPELLANLWLEYTPINLAHENYYYPLTRQDIDRINIGAATFSSHVSVTTNSRLGGRGPLLLFGSGYLSRKEKTGVGLVNLDMTVRSDAKTWADKNADFKFNDGAEMKAAYDVAAAVTRRSASAVQAEDEARVVVLADSDCLTDRVLRLNPGNRYFALDVVKWLGGEERFSGTVSNEEDIPVGHTRKEDQLWFYLSIVAVPAFVLGSGFMMTRKRKRRMGRKSGPSARSGSGSSSTNQPTQPPSTGSSTSEVVP